MSRKDPVKILVAVADEHQPILDALMALPVDIGTVRANLFLAGTDSERHRLLCFGATRDQMKFFIDQLKDRLKHNEFVYAQRLAVVDAPLDMQIAVLLDVPALEV